MFAYDPRFETRKYSKECVGAGWAALVDRCFDICEAVGFPFEVIQVKEKFGGLRFYVALRGEDIPAPTYTKFLNDIHVVEQQSFTVCEECGAAGTLDTTKPWIRTLCARHSGSHSQDDV